MVRDIGTFAAGGMMGGLSTKARRTWLRDLPALRLRLNPCCLNAASPA
ncbi:hypothetical protein ABZ725_28075 [Streptomyces sp. NPDC006872]